MQSWLSTVWHLDAPTSVASWRQHADRCAGGVLTGLHAAAMCAAGAAAIGGRRLCCGSSDPLRIIDLKFGLLAGLHAGRLQAGLALASSRSTVTRRLRSRRGAGRLATQFAVYGMRLGTLTAPRCLPPLPHACCRLCLNDRRILSSFRCVREAQTWGSTPSS